MKKIKIRIEKTFQKKYGQWFLDEKIIIMDILNEYKGYEIICLSIDSGQYELAKVFALSLVLSYELKIKVFIFTNFFNMRILKNQILQNEFDAKMKKINKKLLITIGSVGTGIKNCDDYLKKQDVKKSSYKLIALDYEVMGRKFRD